MKAPKTQGYYYFEDGTCTWFYGLSAMERKIEESKHGKVVKFEHTNLA